MLALLLQDTVRDGVSPGHLPRGVSTLQGVCGLAVHVAPFYYLKGRQIESQEDDAGGRNRCMHHCLQTGAALQFSGKYSQCLTHLACDFRVLALQASAARAADSTPEGKLLIPKDEKDYSNMLSALMDSQHSMLQKTHGVDSPQVALSSNLINLQTSVRALHKMPHNCTSP